MKYFLMTVFSLCCIALLTACGNRTQESETSAHSDTPEISENVTAEDSTESEAIQGEVSEMRVKLTFDGGEAVVRLADNAAARSFFSQLPITQTFEDFNSIEKICRLPNELSTDAVEKGVDPDIADVTLYAPWNTLVFYYEDYGYNDDLIPMGHVESGMELLAEMGEEFTVTIEQMMDEGQETDVSAETAEITMTVGNTVITAELSDSETVRAFLETLPRTFTMNRYGDREYYGRMETITENGESIADFENGDVTYYPAGPSFAVFFAGEESSNQGGLIRMGKITSDLSAFDALEDTVEMRIEIQEQ